MLTGNLEYIMSSLPSLSFSNSETTRHKIYSVFKAYALDVESLKDPILMLNTEAKKFLSVKQFDFFQQITLATIHDDTFRDSKTKIVSEFSRFSAELKQELKTYRQARKSDKTTEKVNYQYINQLSDHPLDAELQLLKLQWDQLDLLSLGHYSDLSALILYKLKLELLLRWWSFDEEVGYRVFQQILK